MNRRSAVATGLVAIAVVLTAGTGFAAFTTGAQVVGKGATGTLGPFVWGSSPGMGNYSSFDNCTAWTGTTTTTGDTLFLSSKNIAPGDICSYGDTLTNRGSLPATTTEMIDTGASGALCSKLRFQDNFFSPSVVIGSGGQHSSIPHTIGSLASFNWAGSVQLESGIGNSFSGQSCTFMVTVTGTAGT
jgi:hypothetical protein